MTDEESPSLQTQNLKRRKGALNLSYLKSEIPRVQNFKDMHQILHSLMVVVDDFSAGTIQMKELLNNSRTRDFKDF